MPMYLMMDKTILAKQSKDMFTFEYIGKSANRESCDWLMYRPIFSKTNKFTMEDLIRFIERRIAPRGRDIEDIEMEKDNIGYSPLRVAKETKACLIEDPFWIAFSEEETEMWGTLTVRGRCGYTPLT
jgi:hypothetical protein